MFDSANSDPRKDGIDLPKEIDRWTTYDAVKDALCDALHVIVDEHGCTLDEACDRLRESVRGELIPGAYYHAQAEQEKDDLCPAGVKIVPPRTPDDERTF